MAHSAPEMQSINRWNGLQTRGARGLPPQNLLLLDMSSHQKSTGPTYNRPVLKGPDSNTTAGSSHFYCMSNPIDFDGTTHGVTLAEAGPWIRHVLTGGGMF